MKSEQEGKEFPAESMAGMSGDEGMDLDEEDQQQPFNENDQDIEDMERLKNRKVQHLNKSFAKQIIEEVKNSNNNLDLYNRQKLVEKKEKQELIIVKATDKVFNEIMKAKDLNKLPSAVKKTNFVEATKLQRQKLELGFNQIPSKYLKEDIIDFVGDLNEKMIE